MNADALSKTTSLYIDEETLSDRPRPTDLQFLAGDSRKEFEDELVKISSEMGFHNEAELKTRQRLLRREEKRIKEESFNHVALIRLSPGYDPKRLAEEQNRDMSLSAMKSIITDDVGDERELTKAMTSMTKAEKQWFRKHRTNLYLTKEGVLMKRLDHPEEMGEDEYVTYAQVIPPQRRIPEILNTAHGVTGGHMGPFRTKSRILRRFDWGGLNRDVDEHVAQCPECQMNKPMKLKPIKHLKPIRTNAPNEMLQVDFLKMVRDDEGYEYIVMMIDHFTKFCVPYPVKKPDSRAAVEAIMNGWIAHHGFPRVIHTDQGVQFESEIFKSMIAAIGAVKTHGSVYRPQTQGLVERQNQTIVTIVRTMSKRQEDWRQHLTAAMIAYNGSRHKTTGRTPHSLMYLHENDPPIGLLFDDRRLHQTQRM